MTALALGWLGCLTVATAGWLVSLRRRDASVVDVLWGAFFVGLGWWLREAGPAANPFHLVHLAVLTVWGFRLAGHIWWRSRGAGEDRRYRAMRERVGPAFANRSLVTVFWLQATLATLLASPLAAVQLASGLERSWLFAAGLGLWAVGFSIEAIADWQLLRFSTREESSGEVLDRGLWRYSRHPNYFGEAVLWWGFGLMAAAAGAWWALWSPVAMTFLLLRVSGVVLMERTIGSRRPGYADYVERTSAFVPWPPRRRVDDRGIA